PLLDVLGPYGAALAQRLRGQPHAGERRAQLVRDVGHEVRLQAGQLVRPTHLADGEAEADPDAAVEQDQQRDVERAIAEGERAGGIAGQLGRECEAFQGWPEGNAGDDGSGLSGFGHDAPERDQGRHGLARRGDPEGGPRARSRASYPSASRRSTAARSLATATTPNATSATLGSSMPQRSQTKARRNSISSDVSAIRFPSNSVGVRCAPRMAKKGKLPSAVASPLQPQTPLAKARWALEAGDVRRARELAAEAARAGPESERVE